MNISGRLAGVNNCFLAGDGYYRAMPKTNEPRIARISRMPARSQATYAADTRGNALKRSVAYIFRFLTTLFFPARLGFKTGVLNHSATQPGSNTSSAAFLEICRRPGLFV
jgi:hypothetical protein